MSIPKICTPIFKFEIVSLADEIELVTEILYDAIVNHSQINYMLYKKYPKLINAIDMNMDIYQIEKAVSIAISESYQENKEDIMQKIEEFKENWKKVQNELLDRLVSDMNSDFRANSIITIKIGNAPLCPRWIDELSFYVPSYIKNFNLIALHECCHFLFFNMYELLFGKCDKEEYDYPSDLWLLSELIIDPILNKDFYTRIIGEEIKAYDYFYDIIKQCIEKCIKFIKINSNCINNC